MTFPFGAALGAGASLIGSGLSFLGGSNALGASQGQNAIGNQMAQQQLAFEEAAAQHGIQWRVDDAKAAGISPLVALGAPTFNPGAIPVSGGNYDNPYSGAGAGLVSMGQDLSRAAMVAQTEKTRAESIAAVESAKASSALTQSQVELNRANTARAYASMATSPSMPAVSGKYRVDGQPDSGGGDNLVKLSPSKVTSAAGTNAGIEAGVPPGVQLNKTVGGSYDPQPALGTSVGATGEDWRWSVRNRLQPPEGWQLRWDGTWERGPGAWKWLSDHLGFGSGPQPNEFNRGL